MIESCVSDVSHGKPVFLLTRHEVAVHRCPRCGTLMADTAYDPGIYEHEGYYSMKFRTLEEIDRYWGMRWRHVLRTLERVAHPTTLLDVGAGNGYFVHLAHADFGLDASGIEISQQEVEFAARVLGTKLEVQTLEEHVVRDYSIATLFNVLEHVPDPLAILRDAREHIRAGGHVGITTPSTSCIQVRVKGLQNWAMIDPPHHMNLFSRKGLELALARAGFRLVHYETLSTYMEWLWKFDTPSQVLRRTLFRMLRGTGLGADHFAIAQRA